MRELVYSFERGRLKARCRPAGFRGINCVRWIVAVCILRTVAKNNTRSTRAHKAVIKPVCTVTKGMMRVRRR